MNFGRILFEFKNHSALLLIFIPSDILYNYRNTSKDKKINRKGNCE